MNFEYPVPPLPIAILDVSAEHSHRRTVVDKETDPATAQAAIKSERRQVGRALPARLASALTLVTAR